MKTSHPIVERYQRGEIENREADPDQPLDADWLRRLALELGADDVGFVALDRAELDTDREDILAAFPWARALVCFVVRMNREPIRSPARSVANLEFHHTGDEINDVAREIVTALHQHGVKAANPSMGFPMEMDKFPSKIWVISHKLVAEAAGLGVMGIHRNVIHPKFGNFILIGTIVLGSPVSFDSQPLDYNPCFECKLCVSACPVGAISPAGDFNFSACYTHNYREFMGGFTDWVEQIADSRSKSDYRRRFSDSESSSMWQSLSFSANYKAAYCLSVCPAGEDVIGPYLDNKAQHVNEIVKPLQKKDEPIYVMPGSDAEDYVRRRFPHKTVRLTGNGLRPAKLDQFLTGAPLVFQSGKSDGLNATYHFRFTGAEQQDVTFRIQDKKLHVQGGHVGKFDLQVTADTDTWIGFVRQEKSIVWALLTRKVRLKGSPKLLLAFGKCFP